MLKYIVLQYIRQKERKIKTYCKRYFRELEPFSLNLAKINFILNFCSFLSMSIIIIFIDFNRYTKSFFNILSIPKDNFFIFSILMIILIKLSYITKEINNKSVISSKYRALNIFYKLIFGQDYVITALLIILISSRILSPLYLVTMIVLIFSIFIVRSSTFKYIIISSFVIASIIKILFFFDLHINFKITFGLLIIFLFSLIYHYFTPRNNNGINRNHQLAVSEKLKNKKKYSFIKLPGFITISQYILIVIPSLIPSYFTSKQLIIYIVIVILIVIITLQIHNSILINLDWYSNFICYLSNSNRNPKILLNILHRNNLKIIFIIGFSIFLESLYIYNQLYWWIFPLLFLIWKIDCSFTYYSFKVLSVSQRENLRQHTNKQLPYVCLIGIAVFLMTTINKIETKIDFSRFGIFVVCLALISLVYILEKEGEVSFIERMERNFNDSYKNQKPKL